MSIAEQGITILYIRTGLTTLRTRPRWPHATLMLNCRKLCSLAMDFEFSDCSRPVSTCWYTGWNIPPLCQHALCPQTEPNFPSKPASAAFTFNSLQPPSSTQHTAAQPRIRGPIAARRPTRGRRISHPSDTNSQATRWTHQPPSNHHAWTVYAQPSLGEYPSRHEVLCKEQRCYQQLTYQGANLIQKKKPPLCQHPALATVPDHHHPTPIDVNPFSRVGNSSREVRHSTLKQ